MATLNAILRGLTDALLYPFRGLPLMVSLTLISLVIGIAMLLVFKVTSNQEKLEWVKRQIHAGLFEIRLFNDDLRAILRAQGSILRHNLSYLGLSLVPLLWMIVPFVLILAQLQFVYGYQGLTPGEKALVKVELKEAAGAASGDGTPAAKPAVRLEVPDGLEIETPALWIPSTRELNWRIAATEWGDYQLGVTVDGETYTKSVRVSDKLVRRSPSRLAPGFVNQLLYPAEDPLPADSPLAAIRVTYPGSLTFMGTRSDFWWLGAFFVLSIVFAFLLRKRLGVTI